MTALSRQKPIASVMASQSSSPTTSPTQPLSMIMASPPFGPTYVWPCIDSSVKSCYLLFGAPMEDHCPPSINTDKWEELASFEAIFLGFHIDTRKMTMAWPVDKHLKLWAMIKSSFNTSPCLPVCTLPMILHPFWASFAMLHLCALWEFMCHFASSIF